MGRALLSLLGGVTSDARAHALVATIEVDPSLRAASDREPASRALLAQALAMLLFEDLLRAVPDAQAYVDDARRAGRRLVLDHGALRTVLARHTGALPPGELAFTRILLPLGYERAGVYPLDRLGMTGRAYTHVDLPASIPQYFVSELHPERFSPGFEAAVERVLASARDPLDDQARASLERLHAARSLPLDEACALLAALRGCFDRQHDPPRLDDYERLLAESQEMAWIATEGNAFNHATDRVIDVERVAAEERAKGRPVKERIEVSASGRVRQTAFRAARVMRTFHVDDGDVVREVPGSFFELIARDTLVDPTTGEATLDLAFDTANATGIFAMTQTHRGISLAARTALTACGVSAVPLDEPLAGAVVSRTPIDGSVLASLRATDADALESALAGAEAAFRALRDVPPPKRGEIVRRFGEHVRAHHDALATLITLEAGKIRSEARGEVQEIVDVCEFAVGLSRQLHGLTIATERPEHRLMETWHPLGPCAVITAFNFPMAVFAWNAALAIVAGDPVVWKPSEKTPLSALALSSLLGRALADVGMDARVATFVLGDAALGEALASDARVKLVSATGSTRMGRAVAAAVAPTFRRTLLELGGNNAGIVTASADLDLAVRAITFAAVGTAGQRCTTMRRLFVHTSRVDEVVARLTKIYASLTIGDPREAGTLVGPLHGAEAYGAMREALEEARALFADVAYGERVLEERFPDAYYVRPAIVRMASQVGPMLRETFAPILYVVPFETLEDAIALHNATSHGLSSSIFTNDLREAELFLSARGSDCGIANVNIGTSGAEIGGAFGGEKDTGGGRESGSDAWKAYMRRATNTIHYGRSLPLAQGVRFDVD